MHSQNHLTRFYAFLETLLQISVLANAMVEASFAKDDAVELMPELGYVAFFSMLLTEYFDHIVVLLPNKHQHNSTTATSNFRNNTAIKKLRLACILLTGLCEGLSLDDVAKRWLTNITLTRLILATVSIISSIMYDYSLMKFDCEQHASNTPSASPLLTPATTHRPNFCFKFCGIITGAVVFSSWNIVNLKTVLHELKNDTEYAMAYGFFLAQFSRDAAIYWTAFNQDNKIRNPYFLKAMNIIIPISAFNEAYSNYQNLTYTSPYVNSFLAIAGTFITKLVFSRELITGEEDEEEEGQRPAPIELSNQSC